MAPPANALRAVCARRTCVNASKALIYKLDDFKGVENSRWPELVAWAAGRGDAVTLGAARGALAARRTSNATCAWVADASRSPLVGLWDHGYAARPF